MFKVIDPQNITKRSFLSHKTFTVTHTTSGSYGNFVVQALSGSKHNYVSGSDLVTHIVSGSGTSGEVSSSYYARPTYFLLKQLHYDNKLNSFETNTLTKRELHQSSSIFSIPRNLYGERIKKGSVKLSDVSNEITFDIRDDEDGNLYVLEINTVPGMTSHSCVPKSGGFAGLSYSDVVTKIISSNV